MVGDASLGQRRRRLASLTIWQCVVHIETSSKTAQLSLPTLRTRWIRASPNRRAKCPVSDCAWTPKVTFKFRRRACFCPNPVFGASHPESLRRIIFPMATINHMINGYHQDLTCSYPLGGIISEPSQSRVRRRSHSGLEIRRRNSGSCFRGWRISRLGPVVLPPPGREARDIGSQASERTTALGLSSRRAGGLSRGLLCRGGRCTPPEATKNARRITRRGSSILLLLLARSILVRRDHDTICTPDAQERVTRRPGHVHPGTRARVLACGSSSSGAVGCVTSFVGRWAWLGGIIISLAERAACPPTGQPGIDANSMECMSAGQAANVVIVLKRVNANSTGIS